MFKSIYIKPNLQTKRKSLFFLLFAALTLSIISMSFLTPALPPGPCPGGAGVIGGNVFNDPNFNGIEDDGMLPLEGFEVYIYEANAAGTSVLVAQTLTDANGDYYFDGLADGTTYRVEFFAPTNSVFKPTFDAANSMTTVQYPTSPSCDVDAGFGCPTDFCGVGAVDMDVVVPCYIAGDPLAGGTAGNDVGIVTFPYNATGSNGTQNTNVLSTSDVGTLWGMTFENTDNVFYGAATLRRHSGYGPGGTGAIYAIDGADLNNASVISTIDLDALGFDTGTDPRIGNPLPANKEDASFDVNAFGLVGKMSFGDIEMSSDGKELYAVNLFDKTIYKIFVDVPFSQPTAGDVTPMPIPDPGCVGGEARPWGLEFYKGKLYVGVVCDASTSQNQGDLHAYVYEHDPAGAPNNFTTVLDFPLDFERGEVFFQDPTRDRWFPWTDNFNDLIAPSGFLIRPQPVLSDIEFTSDGSMILGFMDRTGQQGGYLNYGTDTNNPNLFTTMTGGDLIKVCNVGGTFVLEGPMNCTTTGGTGNNQGPNGNEFFFDEIWPPGSGAANNPTVHGEIAQGALAIVPGTNQVMSGVFDPMFNVNAGGVVLYDTDNGSRVDGYEVIIQSPGAPGKSNQLGDLSLKCPTAPIEVGNYVWIDSNMDGIQDPNEMPIAGVNVALFSESGMQIATTMTDADGEYYFNSNDVAGLDFFENYFIVVGLNQFDVTDMTLFDTLILTIDSTGMGMDTNINDSDGEIGMGNAPAFAQGYPYTPFTTGAAGCNDHSLDFGFNTAPCEISIDAVVPTMETCLGSMDGSIMITVTATNPVQYSIDNGMTFQNTGNFIGLAAGVYSVVVRERDNFNCAETARTVVDEGLRIDPPTGVTGYAICIDEIVPSGDGLVANCAACAMGTSTLTWHTAATGGMNVGSGSPFDPLAAGIVDASVVGTTTFYAQCACGICVSPRVPADFVVREKPEPAIVGAPFVCPGSTTRFTTDFFGGSTYTWMLSGGGTIISQNDNEIEVRWTDQEGVGPFTVSVTESSQFGCTGSTDFAVSTKNTTLACNDNVQISLDENGNAIINPDQILEGSYTTFDCFSVDITDQNGNSLGNTADCRNLGQTLIVTVTGECDQNSCWASVSIEDKLPPVMDCPDEPYRLTCLDDKDAVPAPTATDNCSVAEINLILEESDEERCTLGEIRRTYIAADQGNLESQPCTVVIELLPPAAPKFPEDITWTCEQFKAFPNIIEATVIHEYLVENAALLDRTKLYCQYDDGDDQNFSVPYDERFNYWMDNEDLDVPLDPRYDDVLDNPITDPDPANCATASPETDQLTDQYNISFEAGCPYLTKCNVTPNAHEPTYLDVPVYNSSLPVRGLEDADILAMTGSGMPDIANAFCPYVVSFSDQKIAACAAVDSNMIFKILRTWTVLNWCTGEVISDIQVIKVLDKIAPTIEFEGTLEATANINAVGVEGECVSTRFVAPAKIWDNCSSEWSVQIYTPAGEIEYANGTDGKDGGNIPLPGLGLGNHVITYVATDACGNRSEATRILTVKDDVKPAMICRELTDISLGADGTAKLCAEKLDEGSYDNCGIEQFLVRKMKESNRDFRECIEFNCDDSRDTLIVRAIDYFKNFNDCMVEVFINDKLSPDCHAPADVWTDCTENRGADYSDTTKLQLLFGNAYALDNCHAYTTELAPTIDLDLCGVGTITRNWRAIDWKGNRSNGTCRQTIMIIAEHNYKITIPGDFEEECDDAAPADLTFEENACDLLAINVEEHDFVASPLGECKKVFRNWKIINWCEYDGYSQATELPRLDLNNDGLLGDGTDGTSNSVTGHNFRAMHMYESNGRTISLVDRNLSFASSGYYSYEQQVKIFDNTAPELSYSGDLQFCGGDRDEDPCTGRIDLPIDINELCTSTETRWELSTFSDVFAGGNFTGNNTLNGRYPLGTHTVRYFVEDECGNTGIFDITFEIVDCKQPTPVCHNGLAADLTPNNSVLIWASDFNASSFDYCTTADNLDFRVNKVYDNNRDGFINAGDHLTTPPNQTTEEFVCRDLDVQTLVQLWVGDEAGNWDYCTTFIHIQDNWNHCGAGSKIGGTVATATGAGVKNVSIDLSGNNSLSVKTAADGAFDFAAVAENADYTITPMKNDNPNNGISTFDLLLISKHILNVEPLTSPYKMIAADANRSNTISTLDLVELRKMILHVQSEFTNNTSWRFIEKNHVFADPRNPFGNIPEAINYNNFAADELNTDFVAVKIGDINGDATTNDIQSIDPRTNPNPQLILVENQELIAGESTTVRFEVENASDISGYQFTLDFDPTFVEFEDLIENEFVKAQNFGFSLLEEGAITASWNKTNATDDLYFELTFTALQNANLAEAFKINSRFTKAEAYPINGDFQNVELKFSGSEMTNDGFELYQNTPNPFNGKTVIGFELPQTTDGTITIFDISGKVIQLFSGSYSKGYNEINIAEGTLPAKGIYYYRLETATDAATRKMLFLE